MADEKKQKIAEDFGKELDILQDKLNNMASFLSTKMRDKLSDLATDTQNFVGEFEKGNDVTKNLSTKLTTLQKDINKLSLNRTKLENDLVRTQQDGNIIAANKIKLALNQNKLVTQQLESYQTQLIKLQQTAEEEKKITEEKKKQNSLIENIKNKAKDMFKPATDLFTVTGILDAIVSRIDMFNKGSVKISKSLGYSASEADRVERKMMGISLSSQSTTANLKNLNEAMGDLNTATGGVAEYSADALKTQVMLTKQFGLTGEEAAGIYKFSTLTGKSSEKVNDEMVDAFVNTRNAVKGSADFKTTMAAAAKVSGQLSANFKNDPKLITAAIVKMQAFGTTLEQTKKQGDSLLNWESSLDNELKAELLTGKQLNLERARAAALAGDQVTLAEELAKNVGTLDDFNKMNVVQQKAIAESMGMTADEMANQLQKQKTAQEQGKSIAQVNADEMKEAQKRQAIQDKFNDAMEKLKDIIGSVAVVLAPFIDGLTWLLDNTFALYGVLGLIAVMKFSSIKDSFKGLGDTFKNIKGKLTGKGGGLTEQATEAGETGTEAGGKVGEGTTKSAGEKIHGTLKGIADGIKEFNGVKFSDIGKLVVSALGMVALTPAIPALLLLQFVKGEAISQALGGLASGIAKFGDSGVMKGALGIALISGALIVTAYAFNKFADVAWESVAKGVIGLGAMAGVAYVLSKAGESMIEGSIAIAILGVALIPFAYALSLLANVKMENVLAAAAGLVIFGAAVFGLGAIMSSGVGAVIFGAGILAFIALGGAMIILGIGLKAVSEGGKGIAQLFQQLSELDATKLDAVAPALKTIGEAIMYLGAGGVMGALGKLLGGDSPSKMITDIAASASGITQAATGLQLMATSLQQVASALAAIDTSKLEALSDFASESMTGGITDFISAPIKAIGDMIGGGGGGNENKAMIAAINEVKVSIDKLYSKEMTIKIDGKILGTTLVQGSTKML